MSDVSIRRIPPRHFGGPIRNTASWEIIDDAGYVVAFVDRAGSGMLTLEPRPDEYGYSRNELCQFVDGLDECRMDWKAQQSQPKLSPQLVTCDAAEAFTVQCEVAGCDSKAEPHRTRCHAHYVLAKCDHCDQPATYVNDQHRLCEAHMPI